MKKRTVAMLVAGLMLLEPCAMAGAEDFSDAEVLTQNTDAGQEAETEEDNNSGEISDIEIPDEQILTDELTLSTDEQEIKSDENQGTTEEPVFDDGESENFSDNALDASTAGAKVEKSGRLTQTMTWDFYDNGELVISGTGAMPDYGTEFGSTPWAHCQITEIIISDGVTSLGNNAFGWLMDVKEVQLGKDVQKIGERVFQNDSALTKINFPDKLTTIGKEAFQWCSGLTGELKLPENLTSMGEGAFSYCTSLTSIIIPEKLKELPAKAFFNDDAVVRIMIPSSVTKIGKQAFDDCNWIKYIQFTGTEAQWKKLGFKTNVNLYNTEIICNYNVSDVNKHIWSEEREWDGDAPLDCTATRTQSYHCIICGAIDESSTITVPGKEHSWSKELMYDGDEAAWDLIYDCTKGGTKSYHCTECGAIDKNSTVELPIYKAHKFGAWETLQEATINQQKITERECTVCDVIEKKYGDKLRAYATPSKTAYTLNPQQNLTSLYVKYAKGDSVVSWKSNNTKVAAVTKKENGKCLVVAGKTPGKATLTVTLKSKKTAKVTITVRAIRTTRISGVKPSLTLRVKKTATLKPVLTPKNSTEKVTYKSSNAKIATVTSAGKITAKKKGTAYIYVKSGKKTVKCKVVIK